MVQQCFNEVVRDGYICLFVFSSCSNVGKSVSYFVSFMTLVSFNPIEYLDNLLVFPPNVFSFSIVLSITNDVMS